MQLTNEETARVFAMYWMSCKAVIYSHNRTRYEYDNNTRSIEAARTGGAYILELTPLSKISDEDALEAVKIFHQSRDIKLRKNTASQYLEYAVEYCTNDKDYWVTQYFISKGYAVPLFFAHNHWANNKTAIELELAIDKTI